MWFLLPDIKNNLINDNISKTSKPQKIKFELATKIDPSNKIEIQERKSKKKDRSFEVKIKRNIYIFSISNNIMKRGSVIRNFFLLLVLMFSFVLVNNVLAADVIVKNGNLIITDLDSSGEIDSDGIRSHWGSSSLHIFNRNVANSDFYWGETLDTGNYLFRGSGDMTIESKVSIGGTSPTYPLEVLGNVSGISIWSESNVSATGFMTRTSIFDKSKGPALDLIQDSDYYLDGNGKIDHTKFYGYAGDFPVTDYTKPQQEEYQEEECDDEGICSEVIKTRTIYPETILVGNVDLGREIDVLRQSVYELKLENTIIKQALCSLGEIQFC